MGSMLIAQLVVDGIAKGAVYAALALAIVVVHRSTGVINFAQGEFATLSTMLTAALTASGISIWIAVPIAMTASFIGAAVVQSALVRPIQHRPHMVVIAMTIGLYICASAIGEITFGPIPRSLPSLFPSGGITLGDVRFSFSVLGVLALQAAAILALTMFFSATKAGLGFRAVATAPDESRFVGVPVERMQMVGWGLAAALGAVAGVSLTSLGVFVEPTMMSNVLVYSLAAVTIGGADSAAGAVIGGVLIGIAESLASLVVPGLSGGSGMIVALIVILMVLLIRPQGIFGQGVVSRG